LTEKPLRVELIGPGLARTERTGLAKMFANSERELLAEFKTATNSAQLHKLMADRKMRKG